MSVRSDVTKVGNFVAKSFDRLKKAISLQSKDTRDKTVKPDSRTPSQTSLRANSVSTTDSRQNSVNVDDTTTIDNPLYQNSLPEQAVFIHQSFSPEDSPSLSMTGQQKNLTELLKSDMHGTPEIQNFIKEKKQDWNKLSYNQMDKTNDILRQNPSQECKDFIFNHTKYFTKMQPETMQEIANILNDNKTPKTVKEFMTRNADNIKGMKAHELGKTAFLMIDQDRHIPKFMKKMMSTPQTEHDNKLRTLLATNDDAMKAWSKLDASDMDNIMNKPFCEQMQKGEHLPEKNKADAFLAFL